MWLNICVATDLILAANNRATWLMSDFTTTGDGLIAALQVLSVVRSGNKPVSEVCRKFDPVPQVLKNVRYEEGNPLANQQVIEAIDDGRSRLGKEGRLVIRPSGTEPLIRVMAESDDESLVNQVVNDIVVTLKKAAA